MRRHLTSSTSKHDLIFYSVSETGEAGVAYTYAMSYLKHLLSRATEETVVGPIHRAPQFIHSMKFPEQEGAQPVGASPTIRRLWNGRRGIMTTYWQDPEVPVVFCLIPDVKGAMQISFSEPEKRVQTSVLKHSVHPRPRPNASVGQDNHLRFLCAIGRAMKNAVWVEQRGTPGEPALCLATWPGVEPDIGGASPTQTRVIECSQEVFGDWADTITDLWLDDFYGLLGASTRNGEVFLMYFA
jgi:hypothetical protein